MKLQPYQTHSFDVPALLSLAGLQNFNGSFNLIFDVEGSVLIASGSVDQKNTYVFEVMPESVKESASKGLAYWSTKNGDDSDGHDLESSGRRPGLSFHAVLLGRALRSAGASWPKGDAHV